MNYIFEITILNEGQEVYTEKCPAGVSQKDAEGRALYICKSLASLLKQGSWKAEVNEISTGKLASLVTQ